MAEPVTSRIEREIFFRTFARTARPPEAVTQQFVENLVEQQLPRGAVLFRAGEPSDHIHYVVRGAIELRDPSGLAAPWSFGPRSAVGGIDASAGRPYSRTAVAVEDTLLLKLRTEDYFEILEDNFEFTRFMLGFLYRGVEELSRELAPEVVYPDRGGEEMDLIARASCRGLVERVLVLRSSGPFRGLRLQVLVRLAQEASDRALTTGERLFDIGRGSDTLWFVAQGSVIAGRDRPPFEARFGPGTMVLPFAALANSEDLYRAAAAEPSLVLALRKEDLWDVMEDHPDVIRALLAHVGEARSRLQTITFNREASGDPAITLQPLAEAPAEY